jgi:hypothetical protein
MYSSLNEDVQEIEVPVLHSERTGCQNPDACTGVNAPYSTGIGRKSQMDAF